jgi:hypothetical protein
MPVRVVPLRLGGFGLLLSQRAVLRRSHTLVPPLPPSMNAQTTIRLSSIGYGVAAFLVLKHGDSIQLWFQEMGRSTVHFLSRPLQDPSSPFSLDHPRALTDLSSKLDQLRHDLRSDLRSSSLSLVSLVPGKVVLVTLAGVAGVAYWSGYSVWDALYVTRRQFRTATDALKEGLHGLVTALAKVRGELLDKIGAVEKNLDTARDELTAHITSEAGLVRGQVKLVGEDVANLGCKLEGIEGGVEDVRKSLVRANRGIWLLCHVVAESISQTSPLAETSARTRALYKELLSFTLDQDKNMDSLVLRLVSGPDGAGGTAAGSGEDFAQGLRSGLTKVGVV